MPGPVGEVARPVRGRYLAQTACSGTTRAAGARSVSPEGSWATPEAARSLRLPSSSQEWPTRTMHWRRGRRPRSTCHASAWRGGWRRQPLASPDGSTTGSLSRTRFGARAATARASRSERLDDHGPTHGRLGGTEDPHVVAPPVRCLRSVDPRSRLRPAPGGAAGSPPGRKVAKRRGPRPATPRFPDSQRTRRSGNGCSQASCPRASARAESPLLAMGGQT
jgi:hypothetical protein